MTADPEAEKPRAPAWRQWKADRDEAGRRREALGGDLAEAAKTDANLMDATLAAARAGATTGEWAGTLREVFGEFRAPTGVVGGAGVAEAGAELRAVRERSRRPARSWVADCGCWSASPVWTVTPTAPSRSPYELVTLDSR